MPAYHMLFDPINALRRWEERYGPTFTVNRLGTRVVITSDPELIQQIYSVKDPHLFAASAPDTTDVLLGPESLLLLSGERHHQERKLMTPPFHGERLKGWAQTIADSARRAFSVEGEIRALERAQQVTLDVIIRVVFGVREEARCEEFARVMKRWVDALRPGFLFSRVLQRRLFGASAFARYLKTSEEVDVLLYEQIARARRSTDAQADVLSDLVNARYDDGSSMSDASIRAQLRTLLFAGHDTTATMIAWSLYYVMRTPAVRERVYEELGALEGDTPGDYARLPYLSAVFDETMRIRPVTADIIRLLRKPWRLGRWKLPAGAAISPAAPLTHHRRDLWPEPDEFRPERFLGKRPGPSVYLPFGGGSHRCLGAQFAQFEHATIMGTLLREFEFELLEGNVEWGRGLSNLQPLGGVKMRVRSKSKA